IVEDLERKSAGEAGRLQRRHEFEERQVALAGEAAEVPAPRQRIHVEGGGIGHLHEKDALTRDRTHRTQLGLAREGVETVEHEADSGVIGAAYGLPGIAVVVDVLAPGQSLKADAQPRLLARSPSSLRSAAARSMPPRLSGDTLVHTSRRSQPSSCMT